MYLLCTRINRESPYLSKFPECKQMINEACVLSNCLFIYFFGFLYLRIKITSSRSWTIKWWIPRKTRDFYVFGCSLCQQFLPIGEWRCEDIDAWILSGLTCCLRSFLLTLMFKNSWTRCMVACAAGACQRANQIIADSNLLYIAVSERDNEWVRESAGDSVSEEGK